MLFKFSLAFNTQTEMNDRTIRVAEAFGMGLEDKKFTIFKDVEIDIRPRDLVYITGDSGGGKSLLVRALVEKLREYQSIFGEVCTEQDLRLDPDEILINSAGKTFEEALSYLTFAGLNDAYLFLRRYGELSDGQKYRYKIAKMLAMDKGVFIFDEFCATLDRETAKAVAFCIQKVMRRAQKTLIVATTHDDLIQDFAPSVLIRKDYGFGADVTYPGRSLNLRCSLLDSVKIERGTAADYHKLSFFHYRAGIPYGMQQVYVAKLNGRVIGAAVYSNSPLSSKGRNQYLGRVPAPAEINRNFLIISRVVLLQKFRSIGVAVKLVRESLRLTGKKYVEAISVMGRYNPFENKAGMTAVQYSPDRVDPEILQQLSAFGFDTKFCSNPAYNAKIILTLSGAQLDQVRSLVSRSRNALGNLVHNRSLKDDDNKLLLTDNTWLAGAISWVAKIAQPKVYLIWENKEYPVTEVQADG